MAQYHIYPNPGTRQRTTPYLVAIQNDNLTNRTGDCVVIPLRANAQRVEIMAPLVEFPGASAFMLSPDEIFTIDMARLKHPVGMLSMADDVKFRPAINKVIDDY